MDVIRTAVSMLGLYDPGVAGGENVDINRIRAVNITAKIGIIAAYFHRARQGKDLPPIRKDLGEAAHFLYLINGAEPSKEAVGHTRCRLRPPRRPRHECQHLQRARHHRHAQRHVFRHHHRHRHPQRPAARRRKRRRDPDAPGNRQRGQSGRLGRERLAQKKENHGHRPSRLQNARPARPAPARWRSSFPTSSASRNGSG